jgi:hypothetical protein
VQVAVVVVYLVVVAQQVQVVQAAAVLVLGQVMAQQVRSIQVVVAEVQKMVQLEEQAAPALSSCVIPMPIQQHFLAV